MASPRLIKAVYRSLWRESRRLDDQPVKLFNVMPLQDVATRYGRGSYCGDTPANELQAAWFPKISLRDINPALGYSRTLTKPLLRAVTRHLFRAGRDSGLTIDDALQCLATINRLRALGPCHSVTVTEHTAGTQVTVELTTTFLGYLPEHVMAQAQHYPFAYRVRISNTGNKVVQLLSRHWLFQSEDGRTVEVPKGSQGVVGHAPVLEPGQSFEYYSGTQLTAPRGTVKGSFTMLVGQTEEKFEALIGTTALIGPVGTTRQAGQGQPEQEKAKAA